jgi:ribonuclease P protein component, eubacterial
VSNSLGRYRLGDKQRIADKASFARVLRSRLRVQAGRLALQATKNEGEAGRLGIAVAKRYAKRSVDRNWVKRVVREAFRIHCVKYHPADFLVSLRGPLLEDARGRKSAPRCAQISLRFSKKPRNSRLSDHGARTTGPYPFLSTGIEPVFRHAVPVFSYVLGLCQ